MLLAIRGDGYPEHRGDTLGVATGDNRAARPNPLPSEAPPVSRGGGRPCRRRAARTALLRRFILGRRIPLREEIGRDLPTYVYLGVMTTLVFTSLGRALGKHADLLTALSTTDDLTGLLNA